SRSMGVSKQLSNDLKTKIVHRHGLGEGYRKLSQRFQLSVSTVRNIVRKWKTTGTVQVKARSGRPRKISNKQKPRMLRTVRVNPQTSTKDLQRDLAADGVTVHRSTIRRTLHKEMLYGRVMQRKPFLRPHHKQSHIAKLDQPGGQSSLIAHCTNPVNNTSPAELDLSCTLICRHCI
ncbi:hypothetical protein NFI96_011931, partial [Prochilodus magdalenae]